MTNHRWVLFSVLSMAALSSVVNGNDGSSGEVGALRKGPQLGCHKRVFTYRVTQTDAKGRECWDHVSVLSCHGRCDSNEISDWRFPYKRSHHPVCVHAGRTRSVAVLRHCDKEADPEARLYEYMEPKSCNCQTCTSMDTSCEGPKQLSTDSVTKVFQLDEEEIESEYA
ncbi:thyrostimulin beta-5 subunit [Uranotaenia lowii]|uniref:thyrostimulin beta-5 subunit n=1 Tax=Uranotaenia lowii TaxID=190385 RepID=UPI00247A8979|nr:thyrostimulin beta-5 subunit [Uranotaenia lowii]